MSAAREAYLISLLRRLMRLERRRRPNRSLPDSTLWQQVYDVVLQHNLKEPDTLALAEIQLSVRARKALHLLGCRSIKDIRETPDLEILALNNIGYSTLHEIRKVTGKYEEPTSQALPT